MTKHLFILTLVFGLGSFFSFHVHAAGQATFTSIHENYHSIRAAGMGGAFAAVANDEAAIFYNPAMFARFTEAKMVGVLGDGAFGTGFDTLINNITNAMKLTPPANLLALTTAIQNERGNNYGGRGKLFEFDWIRPNWGISFIPMDISVDLQFGNTLYNYNIPPSVNIPPIYIRYFADTTFAYSYGATIPNTSFGLLSAGITLKEVLRQYMNRDLRFTDTSTDIQDTDKTDGLTTDIDIGLLFTPYLPEGEAWNWVRAVRPTFALVGRNMLDGGFSTKAIQKNSVYQPEKLNRVYDFGMRFEIPSWGPFGGRLAIDQRDIGHPNYTTSRGMHIGYEGDLSITNWMKGQLRVGTGQGFASYGLTGLFTIFRLDFASYGEDVGTLSSPKENRLYELKFSSEF